MHLSQKTTVRINNLFVFIGLVMFLFLLNRTYGSIRAALRKPVTDTGKSYIVCTYGGCKTYDKSLVDAPSANPPAFENPFNGIERSRYYLDVKQAEESISNGKWIALTFIFILSLYTWTAINIYAHNVITVENRSLTVQSSIAASFRRNQSGNQLVTSKYAKINIDSIKGIEIVTTTPLIPDRTQLSQINWRDIVLLRTDMEVVAIELFIFPSFKSIAMKIVELRPGIQIVFTKKTISDNLRDVS